MPFDGTPSDKSYSDRSRHHDDPSVNFTGAFAPYAKDPETIIELMMADRFPLSADSGTVSDVSNSYISGMAALQQVFSPAGVGKFVRPKENTWIRHELAVVGAGLDFSTKRYEFDSIVAHFAKLPAAFDPKNSKYEKYADLRMNIAVMRNYLLNHFFPDGDVDNDVRDQNAAHSLNQVAMHIGKMLERGNQWTPSLGPSVTPSRASVKGEGAAEIYQKLLRGQTLRKVVSPVMAPINFVRGRSNMNWRLPSLEETPFDPRNLAAPLDIVTSDSDVSSSSGGRPDSRGPLPDRERWDVISHSFDDLGAALAGAAAPLATVDDLSQPVKDRAIELARDILEKLKIRFSDMPVAALLDHSDTAEVYKLLRETQQLSQLFYSQAGRAVLTNPNLLYDSDVQIAFDALGKLSCQAKLQALKYSEESGNTENALMIAKDIESMPESWRQAGNMTVGQLLGAVQLGFERVFLHLQEQNQTTDESRTLMNTQEYGQNTLMSAAPAIGQGLASASMGTQGSSRARSSISPLQQQVQQIMASNQIVNMAADRRAAQQDSTIMGASSAGAPNASLIMAAVPPPRPRNPSTSRRTPSQISGDAARRRAAMPQPAAAPAAPAAEQLRDLGTLLNPRDLASMRNAADLSTVSGEMVRSRNAADTARQLSRRTVQDPAGTSNDPNGYRPGNGFNGR